MSQQEIPFVSKLRDEVARTASQDPRHVSVRPARPLRAPKTPRGRHRWSVLTAGGLALSAAIIAVVVLITAGTSPQAAYALTRNPDGSITVTIRNVDAAIPALNARFRQMGINETVLPVKPRCTAAQYFGYPNASPREKLTFHPGDKHLRQGWDGVLAVERLPNGRIAMSAGARKPPLPTCVHALCPVAVRLPNEERGVMSPGSSHTWRSRAYT